MRSQSIRNVIRGLIAAGLVTAGSPIGSASLGLPPTSRFGGCFVSDVELGTFDLPIRFQRVECQFQCELSTSEINELEACRLADEQFTQINLVSSYLSEQGRRSINRSIWKGFRFGFSWVGSMVESQTAWALESKGMLADLALFTSSRSTSEPSNALDGNIFVYVIDSEESNPDSSSATGIASVHAEFLEDFETRISSNLELTCTSLQKGMDPICPDLQNACTFTITAEGSVLSNYESCFADSEFIASAIPVVQRETQVLATVEPLANEVANDAQALLRPPVLESDCNLDPDGVGHCTIASSDPQCDRAEIEIGNGIGKSVESWISPQWNIRSWTLRTNPFPTGTLMQEASSPALFPDSRLIVGNKTSRILTEIPLDPALYPPAFANEVSEDESLRESWKAIQALSSHVSENLTPAAGPWFAKFVDVISLAIHDEASPWRDVLHVTGKQASRVAAESIKQVGLFLLDSANRLEASGSRAAVAGREANQR